MKSHEFQLTPRDLLGLIGPTLVVVLVAMGLLQAARHWRCLPPPPLSLNPDLTMLAHQARASRQRDPAEIVLVGDSTCLMGVDAGQLSRELPRHDPALSLALIIGLDLKVYGGVLRTFAATNPGQVRAEVLLLTPQKLAAGNHSEDEVAAWQTIDATMATGWGDLSPTTETDRLGRKVLRENLLAHVLDTPLRGSGAEYFGFSSQIDHYLTAHRGSLLDFGTFALPRRRQHLDYQLAPGFEAESRAVRSLLPAGTRLYIGLTPGPRSAAAPDDRVRRNELLRQWNVWMQADALLTNLPTTLVDAGFAKSGHLNGRGQAELTTALARELAPLLEPKTGPPGK